MDTLNDFWIIGALWPVLIVSFLFWLSFHSSNKTGFWLLFWAVFLIFIWGAGWFVIWFKWWFVAVSTLIFLLIVWFYYTGCIKERRLAKKHPDL